MARSHRWSMKLNAFFQVYIGEIYVFLCVNLASSSAAMVA